MEQGGDTAETPGRRFAALIRRARQQAGLTQEQLEERSGVSRQTIIRYESGRTANPDPAQVRAVCLALGIDPREAPVALGFFSRAEMGVPAPTRNVAQASLEEVLAILEDPAVSDAEKRDMIEYLKWRRAQLGQRRSTAAG